MSKRFHPVPTLFSILVLLLGFGLLIIAHLLLPPLAKIPSPERSLAVIASRTMELREGREQAPPWERSFYKVYDAIGAAEDDIPALISWHEELSAFSPKDPVAQIHLAILEAESNSPHLKKRIQEWQEKPEPLPTLGRLIRTAYLESGPAQENFGELRAVVTEILPEGWFRNRLMIRLARKAGDETSSASLEKSLRQRGGQLLKRYRVVVLADLGSLLLMGIGILFLLRYRSKNLRVGTGPIPPPWRGSEGITVLIRGAALGTIAGFLLIFLGESNPFLVILSYLLCTFPILFLAWRHLFAPHQLSVQKGLGLEVLPDGWRWILLIALAGMGIDAAGNWLLNLSESFLHLSNHWSEGFDADLVWGSRLTVAVGLLEYIVVAPCLEEILFRGLLFPTLRRRFGWIPSALLSAAFFSLMHGYGTLGFGVVFWSGVVWAWMYERTGSLIPGIAGHAVNNLLYAGSLVLMLRT